MGGYRDRWSVLQIGTACYAADPRVGVRSRLPAMTRMFDLVTCRRKEYLCTGSAISRRLWVRMVDPVNAGHVVDGNWPKKAADKSHVG